LRRFDIPFFVIYKPFDVLSCIEFCFFVTTVVVVGITGATGVVVTEAGSNTVGRRAFFCAIRGICEAFLNVVNASINADHDQIIGEAAK